MAGSRENRAAMEPKSHPTSEQLERFVLGRSGAEERLANHVAEELDRAERGLEEIEAALHAPHST